MTVPTDVVAPVVSNVWKLCVAQGDRVEAGDEIAVLESMKMEIPVHAPVSGTVTELRVGTGVIVQEDDVIAVLD